MIIVTVLYILIAIELRRSSKMNNAIAKQQSSSLNQLTSLSNSTQFASSRPICCQHKSKWSPRNARNQSGWCSTELSPMRSPCLHHRPSSHLGASPSQSVGGISPQCPSLTARPSSAIGTEKTAAVHHHQQNPILGPTDAGRKSLLWSPFSWSSLLSTGVSSQQPKAYPTIALWSPCHCTCQSGPVAPVSRQPRRQQSDHSVLLQSSNRVKQKQTALSYHESLIQHHTSPVMKTDKANKKQDQGESDQARPRQAEISIGPNSVTSVALSPLVHSPTCSHKSHQHPQQHFWPSSQRNHQANRRLAAASSKKSVVRMLGKYSTDMISYVG